MSLAEATVTLGCPKEALGTARALAAVGRLYVADISIPPLVYESLRESHATPFGADTIVQVDW